MQDPQPEKSKTRAKQEMHELQQLGLSLLELPMSQFEQLPLSDELRRALDQARTIKGNSSTRRLHQFIGKLMRHEDTAPIREIVDNWKIGNRQRALEHQQLERMRDQLLQGDEDAFRQVALQFPDLDHQQLRQWVRLAQQEATRGQPPKHARKLFQWLRDSMP